MSHKYQKNNKVIWIVGLLSSLLILASCSGTFSAEDFSSAVNAVPSQKGKGGEATGQITLNEEPSGNPWIHVNHVFGHKWRLTYDHRAQEALLEVAIVIWDEDRHELAAVLHGCDYTFSASNVRAGGDQVRVPLNNLKSRIEDCYDDYSNGIGITVPVTEFYPSIQFEVFGEWSSPPTKADSFVGHDSFKMGFEPGPGSNVKLFLSVDSINGSIEVLSDPAQLSGNSSYMGVVNIDDWASVHDQNIQSSLSEAYSKTGNDPIQPSLKEIEGRGNAIPIYLSDTSLEINVPSNFDLQIIVVDPKGFGSGGPG